LAFGGHTDVYGLGGQRDRRRAHRVTRSSTSPDADSARVQDPPSDRGGVASAKWLIENGGGYDDFAGKLISASAPADCDRRLPLSG